MATRAKRRLTYEDYAHFPDDGRRWELIDGEAFVVPSPSFKHQDIAGSMYQRIKNHLDRHGGGRVVIAPLDVVLSDVNTVQPDVVFVSDEDADVITEKNIRGAPTWAIEVVSDPVRDKLVKRDLYARFGISEYWAVDPDLRVVEIHRAGREPEIVAHPEQPEPAALPGLRFDLDELFGPER